jgi:hypothetical protein
MFAIVEVRTHAFWKRAAVHYARHGTHRISDAHSRHVAIDRLNFADEIARVIAFDAIRLADGKRAPELCDARTEVGSENSRPNPREQRDLGEREEEKREVGGHGLAFSDFAANRLRVAFPRWSSAAFIMSRKIAENLQVQRMYP